jgi:putative transposase
MGQIWHITHRCHKREFLLKFTADRQRWLQWLFEAKKRYGLVILNYTVTSNHIHLLVADDKSRDVIPNSVKLIAGRTGQEFNQRKIRKGLSGKIVITLLRLRIAIICCSALYILIL